MFGQFRGNCLVVGRKCHVCLYDHSLTTYDEGDVFDQSALQG
ncbi:MAG: argininosuccinate synthase [Dehalococcoidia bacterium]|nr:argininosuccinate synthase [Dehalococcoidia bacterium]